MAHVLIISYVKSEISPVKILRKCYFLRFTRFKFADLIFWVFVFIYPKCFNEIQTTAKTFDGAMVYDKCIVSYAV